MYLTATRHREDESCHLIVKNPQIETKITIAKYADLEQRYCPAQVYEIIKKQGQPRLQINASNCIHFQTCGDIKDPA
ncbi:4Fe-4S dicluster domain-containing protein [Candidatus Coxiella mudrowiae]|uniref:4Fe-4S dicluster domain-containing protein n=1 Tax=Candidatus Coxiella mudrowiae TaxID=2054173 RepID=UPI001FD5E7E9|nr:4Fe-4S dicluster domain-containing protein [Candidatus Coxiella mudrowiae]